MVYKASTPVPPSTLLQPHWLTLLSLLSLFLPLSFSFFPLIPFLSSFFLFLPPFLFSFPFYLFSYYLLSAYFMPHRYRQYSSD